MSEPDRREPRQRQTGGTVVSVRLRADEADLLRTLARRDGRTLSETLRAALQELASRPQSPEALNSTDPATRGGVLMLESGRDLVYRG